MVGKIDHSVGVTPLVVVPGDDLDEVGGELDTGIGIEDGTLGPGEEILRDDGILGVTKNSLKVGLRGLLDSGLDVIVGGGLIEADGEVNNGDVGGGDTESHTSELTVKIGDDLTDGLGGTSGGWNDVGTRGTTGSPVLSTYGGTINSKLVNSNSVDGGHETLNNTVVIMENLGNGGKAVGGAGGVGDNIHAGVVTLMVNTNNENRSVVLGRSGDDGLLGTTLLVKTGGLLSGEDTSGLSDVVSTGLAPWDVLGVLLVGDDNLVSIDKNTTVGLLDVVGESTVGGVVFEQVHEVVDIHEGVVDVHNLSFVSVLGESRSEGEAANSTEAVDSESDVGHGLCVLGS
mmetsp:Transcript_34593/g.46626  ORF Transcript_34593/g.46626 Transcript_34593/m.46626 type:complete len:343 (+) Transcript_34593:87-1115(+)